MRLEKKNRMDFPTEQVWKSEFGRAYTDRNNMSLEEMEALCQALYGVTRMALNRRFLDGIKRSAKILEVGANLGLQLLSLQQMGFVHLWGIELQAYPLAASNARRQRISMVQGSAFHLPFKDATFDLVFTSGLLIHIHPAALAQALREIRRFPSGGSRASNILRKSVRRSPTAAGPICCGRIILPSNF